MIHDNIPDCHRGNLALYAANSINYLLEGGYTPSVKGMWEIISCAMTPDWEPSDEVYAKQIEPILIGTLLRWQDQQK